MSGLAGRLTLGVVLFSFSAAASAAESPMADVPLVDEAVRQAMQDRDYQAAVEAIDKALKTEDAPRDYLAYLRGRALFFQGQYDQAVAAFDGLSREFPQSPWARRARFASAAAMVQKGDFQSAEQVYRREADALLSADRKQELADIYLHFADSYFRPPKDDQKPDYQQALEFYQKALELGPKPEKRTEIELVVAQCQQELGKTSEAIALYEQFIKEHAESPLAIEARFRLGQCLMAEQRPAEARRAWQDLLAAHGNAASPRIAEAAFQLSRTWGMPDPQNDEQLTLGLAALDAFLERFPNHELAGEAHLDAARSLIGRGRHQDATTRLETFLADERHRQLNEIPAARVLLGQAYLAQKKFTEAIAAWRDYLARHPTDAAWSTVQQQVINVEYLMALDQYRARDFAAARKLLGEFVAKYPLDSRHPGVLVLLGQMDYKEKQWDAAIAQWRRVVSKYPGSEEASFAQYLIAATLEQELGRFEEAIDEYRKVTSGRKMADAAAAISRLAAKSMTVATERVFRSDETPRLKLTTRNVETVTVRAYLVDLETYFRKMQRGGGIEGLDIALIDPDATFEFKIPQYAKYQQLESRLEVPLPGEAKAGVMAVTVTSATLEATTMVIQSDLDVIVKSSRDEVFVFAENMVTGKPWPGAKLLVSDGQRVFAEGVTGEDGVFRKMFAELREAPNVRVMAAAAGHTASNLVELSGVGVSQGLTDKGYLYTDRPVYRPGQRVRVRGVIRQVDGDVYSVDKGKPYRLEVLDPRGRPVHQQDVTLGDFGSFHDEFPLPSTSPQGDYRIVLRDQGEREYQGAFQVAEYRLEPVRLSVDTPRRVYYRGEEIEGSIRAEFYYGVPLVGREVRYQLAGDRVYTARTDGHGEVQFKLPTREYSETQTLELKAWIPEMNLTATTEFMLAARGLEIKVTTVRDVFVSGESFEATVKITDAAGKPVSQKATLKVLELTEVQGKFGERLVEEHELETAADGVARKTITVAQGGRYRLRAEATDRFHQLLDGQCDVLVSGDDDEVRLRVLADRHTYRAGDDAEVTLHWREPPALALVTLQGAKVLRYQLVELRTGANKLPLPMTAELAPNFELDVAVMTDARDEEGDTADADLAEPSDPMVPPGPKKRLAKRFHQASSPFAVERDLRVAVEWKSNDVAAGAVEPGQEVEVTVTTTDPQGKPVAAEVSLAMVEKALLERFASAVPAIDDFFRGNLREPALRTTSSITFNYYPATRPVNPRLLSERERVDLAAEEAASRREWSLGVELSGTGGGRAGAGMAGGMGGGTFGGGVFSGDLDIPFAADGAMADFDSLIGLITSDGSQTEWFDVHGRPIDAATATVDLPLHITESAATHDRRTQEAETADPFALDNERMPAGSATIETLDPFAAANSPMPAALADEFGAKQFITKPATKPAQPDFAVHETGYWNPAIVTDDDGKATVTLAVPHRVTAWVLAAKGISHETLAGESVRDLVAKKTLFGQLKLPAAFTAGDEAQVVATIHESAAEHGPIVVSLKTTLAGRTIEEKQVVDWSGAGIRELPFDVMLRGVDAAAAGEARFELTVAEGERQDVTNRSVPVRPHGLTVYATAGGSAEASTTVWVEAPAETPFASPRLEIVVGPTIERSLLDVVFGPPTPTAWDMPPISTGEETAASDLMAALALEKLIAAGSPAAGPEAQALDQRVRAAVSSLVNAQNDKGGWNWASSGDRADPYTSARSVWALSLARKAGYVVPDEAFDKAIQSLGEQAAATDNSDHETKAILLHALATAGQGDFAVANRLYRDRPSLTTAALLYLALAFVEMDRQPVAAELIELVAKRSLDDSPAESACHHSPAELRALHALALQAVAPQSPQVKELVDWLLAHRTCHRWLPDRATGPATLALCQWFGHSRFEGEKYRLAITVNGFDAGVLELDQASSTKIIKVPPRLLVKGKQRIQFQITGRGRYSYQAILSGFVPADELKSTVAEWRVQRVYEPAPLERDGREIPRGFDVLQGAYKAFRNPLTQLPVGRRGQVELQFSRPGRLTAPDRQLEYLVLTEPLPAGVSVVEHSVRGPFERFEIGRGAITFYLGNRHRAGTIRYEMVGYLPGSYHAAPSVVRNVYRPEQIAVSAPKSLEVVPSGTASADEYTMTPRELLELGKLAFDGGNMPGARGLLTELISKWNLKPDAYRNTVRMLLDVHLDTGPAADVVRYFEIVKERWPDEQIPFAKIMKVGAAYHEMGEYERSYLVFRATVETNFTLEGGVAGFLASKGEFLRSIEVMTRLVREYPPESYVAAAQYALAQQVYAKAPEAANDPKLREAKINRVDLIGRAWRMLEAFLTDQPDDPAADRAAFAAANTLLDLEKNAEAAAAAERYARRYPASKLLDSFWYIIGYGRFATGEHEAALAMFRKVAETAPEPPGEARESANKWPAVFLLGQIHHSLGQAAEAIREYRRVEDRFPDAKKSIEYFLRKAVSLPEITTVKPGEAVEVELEYRNIASCEVKVYRIDLLKFTLLRQNLAGVTQINLAGIRPQHEAALELGNGLDYRDRSRRIALPLEEEGAYLVVCRGESLYASGLVLITPLVIEVQHDPAAQEVRTTVKDAVADRYLNGVEVKATGSGNREFVSGTTDRRGVFVATGIQGTPTVIAQSAPGRYAFHRGQRAERPAVEAAADTLRTRIDRVEQHYIGPGTGMPGAGLDPVEREIEARLDRPTTVEFQDTPLSEAILAIGQQHGIPVRIDRRSLEDVGMGTDTPVTFSAQGTPLHSLLDGMLDQMDLVWLVDDGCLLITTPETSEDPNRLRTVVYPVTDLVRVRDSEGKEWTDFDTLIETILSNVRPTTWDEVGGPGSVSPMQSGGTDVLVVTQSQATQRELGSLLARLRAVRGPGSELPVRPRPAEGQAGMGFGGMGGGMGGMGGMSDGPVTYPPAMPQAPAPPAGNELLKGLQDTNRDLQGREVQQLQDMYNRGMGGKGSVGAGAAF